MASRLSPPSARAQGLHDTSPDRDWSCPPEHAGHRHAVQLLLEAYRAGHNMSSPCQQAKTKKHSSIHVAFRIRHAALAHRFPACTPPPRPCTASNPAGHGDGDISRTGPSLRKHARERRVSHRDRTLKKLTVTSALPRATELYAAVGCTTAPCCVQRDPLSLVVPWLSVEHRQHHPASMPGSPPASTSPIILGCRCQRWQCQKQRTPNASRHIPLGPVTDGP